MIVMKIVRMIMVKSDEDGGEDSEDDGGNAEVKATSTLCGTR